MSKQEDCLQQILQQFSQHLLWFRKGEVDQFNKFILSNISAQQQHTYDRYNHIAFLILLNYREVVLKKKNLQKKQNLINILQKILIIYKKINKQEFPFQELVNNQQIIFSQQNNKNRTQIKVIQKIRRKIQCLYPLIKSGKNKYEQKKQSIFAYYQKNKKIRGNPNWLISRWQLYLWYQIKNEQFDYAQMKCLCFLLSLPQFAQCRFKPQMKLWAELYNGYTQLILQQEQIEDQQKITWKRGFNVSNLKNRSENETKQQAKLLIDLTIHLLKKYDEQELFKITQRYIQIFMKKQLDISQLFHISILLQIMQKNGSKIYKKILQPIINKIYMSDNNLFNLFLPIFLNIEEELLSYKSSNLGKLPPKLPLTLCQQAYLARRSYQYGILVNEDIQYLNLDCVQDMLTTHRWLSSEHYRTYQIQLIQNNFDIFCDKISRIRKNNLTIQNIQQGLRQYLYIWKIFHQVITTCYSIRFMKLFQKNQYQMPIHLSFPYKHQQLSDIILNKILQQFQSSKNILVGNASTTLGQFWQTIINKLLPQLLSRASFKTIQQNQLLIQQLKSNQIYIENNADQ